MKSRKSFRMVMAKFPLLLGVGVLVGVWPLLGVGASVGLVLSVGASVSNTVGVGILLTVGVLVGFLLGTTDKALLGTGVLVGLLEGTTVGVVCIIDGAGVLLGAVVGVACAMDGEDVLVGIVLLGTGVSVAADVGHGACDGTGVCVGIGLVPEELPSNLFIKSINCWKRPRNSFKRLVSLLFLLLCLW